MKRKTAALVAVCALALCLEGCSTFTDGLTGVRENAEAQVKDLTAFASEDITAATTLSGSDALNYPAAAQCLPVLSEWLTKLKTDAARYRDVKGAASAVVYKHWAKQTLVKGFPEKVTLACSAMWVTEKGDFSDALGAVKTLLGK